MGRECQQGEAETENWFVKPLNSHTHLKEVLFPWVNATTFTRHIVQSLVLSFLQAGINPIGVNGTCLLKADLYQSKNVMVSGEFQN